jgi:hypothetical protein
LRHVEAGTHLDTEHWPVDKFSSKQKNQKCLSETNSIAFFLQVLLLSQRRLHSAQTRGKPNKIF